MLTLSLVLFLMMRVSLGFQSTPIAGCQRIMLKSRSQQSITKLNAEKTWAVSSRRAAICSIGLAYLGSMDPAFAVLMDSTTEGARFFSAGESLSVEDAKARFKMARIDLQDLIDNYDAIVKEGGGDNVRRYLGTVGVSSRMYGILKVMKDLKDEADDLVEYTETMNEFEASMRAADTACYSANFVEFSAAKTRPEKFFEEAKVDAKRMADFMDMLAAQLKL